MQHNIHQYVTGTLCPISWNKEDKINGYSVFTEDDEDILLRGAHLHSIFENFKNKKVRLFGDFLQSTQGTRVFEVAETSLSNEAA